MAGVPTQGAARRASALVVIALALALASGTGLTGLGPGAATPANAAAGACAHANDAPGEATAKQFRRAIRCLIDKRRANKDLRKLRSNGALDSVAQRHTRVMLKKDCFAHKCSGEKSVSKRLKAAGYPRSGDRYGYGENTGYSGTPKSMLTGRGGWMKSRFHRRNILGKRYLHIGVGAGRGIPVKDADDSAAVTYTVIFAWRKRAD